MAEVGMDKGLPRIAVFLFLFLNFEYIF